MLVVIVLFSVLAVSLFVVVEVVKELDRGAGDE